jgi:hypothetical protein
MQRILPLLAGVLGAFLASGPAAWGQGARPAASTPVAETRRPEPVPAPQPAHRHTSVRAANEQLVAELTVILHETSSPDTFLVTVKALADIGARSKVAVPSIIRNAERLGLLKNILQQADDDEKLGPGVMISEAIQQIVSPRRDRQDPREAAPAATPPVPLPPPPASVVSPLGGVPGRARPVLPQPTTVRN